MHAKENEPKTMSAFLSTIILLFGGLLFAIALVYWDKGGYANNWKALWWRIGAFVMFGVGTGFTFYNNVIEPSKRLRCQTVLLQHFVSTNEHG